MKRSIGFLVAIVTYSFAFPVFALTVSPAKIEITGDPGTTVTGEIELLNEQEGARTFYSSTENFEPSGESGAPHFIGAKDGLATWINVVGETNLAQGDKKNIPFSISIPKDAQPGGYFAAIFLGTQPPSNTLAGGDVSVGGRIGVLVLLRVSGYVPEGGGLLDFTTSNNQRFFTKTPISFTYRLNNTGGDRIVPQGVLEIKNSLWITAAEISANKSNGSVLPNSTRKFDTTWGESQATDSGSSFFARAGEEFSDFHFGVYTAKLNVVWGSESHTDGKSYVFFVIPWHALLIVFLVAIVLLTLGRFGLKRYNTFIISQAMRQK